MGILPASSGSSKRQNMHINTTQILEKLKASQMRKQMLQNTLKRKYYIQGIKQTLTRA